MALLLDIDIRRLPQHSPSQAQLRSLVSFSGTKWPMYLKKINEQGKLLFMGVAALYSQKSRVAIKGQLRFDTTVHDFRF